MKCQRHVRNFHFWKRNVRLRCEHWMKHSFNWKPVNHLLIVRSKHNEMKLLPLPPYVFVQVCLFYTRNARSVAAITTKADKACEGSEFSPVKVGAFRACCRPFKGSTGFGHGNGKREKYLALIRRCDARALSGGSINFCFEFETFFLLGLRPSQW